MSQQARAIAERGPMRLHTADTHLYRARLFYGVKPYPWKSPLEDLAEARKLIEQCGYGRRRIGRAIGQPQLHLVQNRERSRPDADTQHGRTESEWQRPRMLASGRYRWRFCNGLIDIDLARHLIFSRQRIQK